MAREAYKSVVPKAVSRPKTLCLCDFQHRNRLFRMLQNRLFSGLKNRREAKTDGNLCEKTCVCSDTHSVLWPGRPTPTFFKAVSQVETDWPASARGCEHMGAQSPAFGTNCAPLDQPIESVPFRMTKKLLLSLSSALIMVSASHLAHAQSTPATAPAPSAAKKELIAKILKIQQSGIEAMSADMAQEPALQMLERAAAVLQARVAPEKREATIKGVQADAKKYMEKTVPMVRSRALALAPDTVGAVLNLRLTEDELRKVIAILESPEYIKFQQLSGEMQQTLQAKLVADTRTGVETNLKALEADLTARLNAAASPPAENMAPAPDASKAAKPTTKQ